MINKEYYFLSGVYRSGNTLISSLLNQNPKIYSSELSSLPDVMFNLSNVLIHTDNSTRSIKNQKRIETVMRSAVNDYYLDVDKEHIFDREKFWALPSNFDLILKYITKEPKVVFTVRPTTEVLASIIKIMPENIIEGMHVKGWSYKKYLTESDNMCDFLMSNQGFLGVFFDSYNTVNNPLYRHMFHIVEYKDIVSSPQKTLDSIYDFVGIDRFIHDFNNIKKNEESNDEVLNWPKNLHDIRTSISASPVKAEDYLSDYAMTKYSVMDFWKI